MPEYLSPGVYVEEPDGGTKPIEAVGTAVGAFIGYTEQAFEEFFDEDKNPYYKSYLRKPVLVTNWSQYVQKFGGFHKDCYLPDAVYGFFANGGGRCYVVSIKTVKPDPTQANPATVSVSSSDKRVANLLTFRSKSFGAEGNNVRISVTPTPTSSAAKDDKSKEDGKDSPPSSAKISTTKTTFSLKISKVAQPPEQFDNLTLTPGDRNYVAAVLEKQSQWVDVAVASVVLDDKTNTYANVVPSSGDYSLSGGMTPQSNQQIVGVTDYNGDIDKREGLGGLEPLDDVTMIAVPDLMMSLEKKEIDLDGVMAVQKSIIDYCDRVKYCFAILDTPPKMMPQQILDWRLSMPYDSSRAALYYPWIEIADMTGSNGRTRAIPPSGHLAGVYARSDNTRGVHKAPANEVIRGVLGLQVNMTKGENDMLNPKGINAIRAFPGRGIRVWGARTLSSDPSWRYINVRRLFSMIEESIENGTQWVVFEPNDPNLWARVERDIRAFLKVVWRTGALFGNTPQEAFYVKCDAETNPPELRDLGQLVVEVGLAPVKPAEFVIFRISQWAGPNATE